MGIIIVYLSISTSELLNDNYYTHALLFNGNDKMVLIICHSM